MITNRMLLAGVVGLLVAALVACEEGDSPQNFGLVQDADDHGDSSSEAMALDVGSTVDRDIEVIGGMDFFILPSRRRAEVCYRNAAGVSSEHDSHTLWG